MGPATRLALIFHLVWVFGECSEFGCVLWEFVWFFFFFFSEESSQ